jgi:hypothetical protein
MNRGHSINDWMFGFVDVGNGNLRNGDDADAD